MVRCNIPHCSDERFESPYPEDGEEYKKAVIKRNESVRKMREATEEENRMYAEMLKKTPRLTRNQDNILTLEGKLFELMPCFPPQFIHGQTERQISHSTLRKAEEFGAEAFEQSETNYIQIGEDTMWGSAKKFYYQVVQYYKISKNAEQSIMKENE